MLMAELLDNDVLAHCCKILISRCALITLLYQSENAASHSHDEHVEILQAIVNKDASKAKKLMHSHLPARTEDRFGFERRLNDDSIANH